MCHSEVPAGQVTPDVAREEVRVPLPGGGTLPALLTRAAADDAPAVLLVHDILGRTPFYEDLAARLAVAGFNALLPDCFCRQGGLPEPTRDAAFARYPGLDEPQTLRDLPAAPPRLGRAADAVAPPRRARLAAQHGRRAGPADRHDGLLPGRHARARPGRR